MNGKIYSKLWLLFIVFVLVLQFSVASFAEQKATIAPTLMAQASNQGIKALAFSPDGKYLASASYNSEVVLWEVSSWNILRRMYGEMGGETSGGKLPGGCQPIWSNGYGRQRLGMVR